MTVDRTTVLAGVRRAVRSVRDEDTDVRPGDHLVDDLGFDSAGLASLTIALEDEFDDVLLLSDWIASAGSPSELTVESLVDYLLGLLGNGA
ncbi:MAG TPA: acyl carrier protein [Candidatus Binatia bacterium]|nr:acyl carrier protein [Candidatus Binatia bacterium]